MAPRLQGPAICLARSAGCAQRFSAWGEIAACAAGHGFRVAESGAILYGPWAAASMASKPRSPRRCAALVGCG
jgi:hypothetical protein